MMAAEERLIKANTLLKAIDPDKVTWRFGVPNTLDTMVDFLRIIINEQPAVDAVEVVHGRWEDEYGGAFSNPRYRCSVCKGRALYRHEQNCLGGWEDVQALTDYCPLCGAKMDGDGSG